MVNVDAPIRAVMFELQSYLDGIENNNLLREAYYFDQRLSVIDSLEVLVIDRIEEMLYKPNAPIKLRQLKYRAEKLKAELEEININLCHKIRREIRAGRYTGEDFKNLIREYFPLHTHLKEPTEETGYDNLDIFINELLGFDGMPEQTIELEPDMIYYQKTPAKIILDLVEKSHFSHDDVFVDLGSGLGQVVILVNLLTKIKSIGIELEPAFCRYAKDKSGMLELSGVTFIQDDVRNADYSSGTVFFMFTPFSGKLLQEVLGLLKKEALHRKIKIISYGPCTTAVATQNWLYPITPKDDNIYKPAVFSS